MLFDALASLLSEKGIEEISVADIAGRASLNRGTFYDHYSDKFSLLEGWAESRFHELLSRRNIRFEGSCAYALVALTLVTCDYLAEATTAGCPNKRQMDKHFESAIVSVIQGMILSGLSRHPPVGAKRLDLMAALIAGAIYGSAREWTNSAQRGSPDDVADLIFGVFGPMMVSSNEPLELRTSGHQ
jgi:AcrR family transcriptional regulator